MKNFIANTGNEIVKLSLKVIFSILLIIILASLGYSFYSGVVEREEKYSRDSLSYTHQIDSLVKRGDSLEKNVIVREVEIVKIKKHVDTLRITANSSYDNYINNQTLSNCDTALKDCRKLTDSLDSECNLLTQQNADLYDLHDNDSLTINAYSLALNNCQNNSTKINKQIKKERVVRNIFDGILIGVILKLIIFTK